MPIRQLLFVNFKRFSGYVGLILVICAVVPTQVALANVSSYALPFPLALYSLAMRNNPLGLLFALLAAIPYVVPFGEEVSHRFLTYSRTRANIRRTVVLKYFWCSLLTAAAFFFVGLLPYAVTLLAGIRYSPENYFLNSPGQIAKAESEFVTFSELMAVNPWAYGLFYSAWLAVNAAVYASLALSATLLSTNRFIGLSLPWVCTLVATFVLAVLGFEEFSPSTVTPFNLDQLEPWQPVVPFVFVLAVAALASVVTAWNSPQLRSCQ